MLCKSDIMCSFENFLSRPQEVHLRPSGRGCLKIPMKMLVASGYVPNNLPSICFLEEHLVILIKSF
jgi:hypothetical protein